MAGAGYKLFNTGDVLTAAQVNTYLMEQTVMVFANAAARTTALSGVVSEGMISYLKDTNAVEVYDGSNWVSSDDPNAIQNTIVDAKGDLITATAADTPSRIAVGNNGETLVADSSTSTGLRYTSGIGLTQPVINGGMDVWQRGTSISIAASNNGYLADRWQTYTNANQAITVSRQSVADSTNLPFIQYCMRYQRNSGQTGTGDLNMGHNIETANSIPLAGKTITLSFYARAGANYSPTSSLLRTYAVQGTGTDQNFFNGYTGQSSILNDSVTLTTTWQRFSKTFNVGSTATQVGFYFAMQPTGTASTNDYYEITGLQIDVGNVALPFRRAGGTLAGELAACQRYYIRLGGNSAYETVGISYNVSTTAMKAIIALPVMMRTKPSSMESSLLCIQDTNDALSATLTNLTLADEGRQQIRIAGTGSGLNDNSVGTLLTNNSTSGYIAFNAEL